MVGPEGLEPQPIGYEPLAVTIAPRPRRACGGTPRPTALSKCAEGGEIPPACGEHHRGGTPIGEWCDPVTAWAVGRGAAGPDWAAPGCAALRTRQEGAC